MLQKTLLEEVLGGQQQQFNTFLQKTNAIESQLAAIGAASAWCPGVVNPFLAWCNCWPAQAMEPTELVCVNGVSTESSPECTIQNVANADVAQVRTEFNGKVETLTALVNAIVSQVDLAAVRHDQVHSA